MGSRLLRSARDAQRLRVSREESHELVAAHLPVDAAEAAPAADFALPFSLPSFSSSTPDDGTSRGKRSATAAGAPGGDGPVRPGMDRPVRKERSSARRAASRWPPGPGHREARTRARNPRATAVAARGTLRAPREAGRSSPSCPAACADVPSPRTSPGGAAFSAPASTTRCSAHASGRPRGGRALSSCARRWRAPTRHRLDPGAGAGAVRAPPRSHAPPSPTDRAAGPPDSASRRAGPRAGDRPPVPAGPARRRRPRGAARRSSRATRTFSTAGTSTTRRRPAPRPVPRDGRHRRRAFRGRVQRSVGSGARRRRFGSAAAGAREGPARAARKGPRRRRGGGRAHGRGPKRRGEHNPAHPRRASARRRSEVRRGGRRSVLRERRWSGALAGWGSAKPLYIELGGPSRWTAPRSGRRRGGVSRIRFPNPGFPGRPRRGARPPASPLLHG